MRISGGAITGSGADGREDEWSDVDLAFAVSDAAELAQTLADWTVHMYDRHRAVHHTDIEFGAWIYRTFLLPSTLQVDLAFAPVGEFRALGPTFRLVFGQSNEPLYFVAPKAADIIAPAWPVALDAQRYLARRRLWQAEYMISGLRDRALALACIRYGFAAHHGRGVDLLPGDVIASFANSLIQQMDAVELSRAFQVVVDGFLYELRYIDQELAGRLQEALKAVGDEEDERPHIQSAQPGDLVGVGWLYALHARSSIARGKLWQAEYMISGLRDNALALACMRHGLPVENGSGMDSLPSTVTAHFRTLAGTAGGCG